MAARATTPETVTVRIDRAEAVLSQLTRDELVDLLGACVTSLNKLGVPAGTTEGGEVAAQRERMAATLATMTADEIMTALAPFAALSSALFEHKGQRARRNRRAWNIGRF